jgi:gliding motility-associated-like protein
MRLIKFGIAILVILLVNAAESFGTHIRAGEIIATLIDCQSNTYRLSLIGYTDTGSTVVFGGGLMNFGDGSEEQTFEAGNPDVFQDLGQEVALNIFYTTHTFPGPGTYTIQYREFNRNASVANMDNSVNTPFYVETVIVIDPFFGCNNTPVLLNPPLDRGCVGKAFYHNPAAWDVDGDSLSYEIVVNKQDRNVPVSNFRLPHVYDLSVDGSVMNEEQTGPPTYTLDPVTGDLIWDAPGTEDEYNIAFIIKEWRYFPELDEWIEMGYVTRDMQIITQECENERPELTLPPDTCIEAGTLLEEVIMAVDPDGHRMTIEVFGGPFELLSSPATYSPLPEDPVNPQPNPASIDFTWQTNCSHVRSRPYQITVKATDFPDRLEGPSLVDFATWKITVVGPAPEGLTAEGQPGRRINLAWDEYLCEQNAGTMQIWRRVDSYAFEPDNCETGMPEYAGYEMINTVPIGQTEYLDGGGAQGLAYGATYCYRIVAEFNLPAGGESYVSEEVCITIEEDEERFGPVITRVSVVETDKTAGIIDLQWTSPFEVDPAVFPPPYTYEIYRYNNQAGTGNFTGPIAVADTFYTDTGIDTEVNELSYRIVAYDANDVVVDTSALASSVKLEGISMVNSLELFWRANVPWSNNTQEYPWHYIFRDHVDDSDESLLILIDSVNVNLTGFRYMDSGQIFGEVLDENLFYRYYVTTQGSYGNPQIIEPLINNSQIIGLQPNDTIIPCVIIEIPLEDLYAVNDCQEFIQDKPCNFEDYYHEIFWNASPAGDENDPCYVDITYYEVWFSEDCSEESYVLIGQASDTVFLHENLESYKGCYKIRAVDRSGNTSEFSEVIAFENCPYYELPNIFTPNNDGSNDVFRAYDFPLDKCPRFVQSVTIRIYNRWGKEVFSGSSEGESSILINWDGVSNDGVVLSTGVYYYEAEVIFNANDPDLQMERYRGWVQILR